MTQKEALQRIKDEIGKLTLKHPFARVFSDIGWDTWGYSESKNGDITGIGLPRIGIPLIKTNILSYLKFFPQLSSLNLSVNNLIDIKSLEELENLSNLYLQANQISDISPLAKLQKLSFLNLGYNKIISDIEPLSNLTNLTWLDLSFNKIVNIQPLASLKSLNKLYLRNNAIEDLKPLSSLISLTILNIRENNISDISIVKELSNLNSLDFRKNKIEDLTGIENLQHLNLLDLSDNPIINPPPEIAYKGLNDIKAWLANPTQKVFVNEVKVILVGRGYAGKTTLVKCLKDENPDPNEPQTHRIKINDIIVPYRGKEVKLNFWDFGGQDVMHSLHQFFMSKRSIYMLVLDGRKDEDPEYWLSMIRSLAGDSPVLVVLNKKDTNPSYDVDRRFLKRKYPFIFGYYETACLGNIKGITELKNGLIDSLKNVPIVGSPWHISSVAIKDKLVAMTSDFISQNTYGQLCAENDVTQDKDKEQLADFLNDLGIVVHFKDINLESMYILRPQWVSRAAYKIINSSIVANNKGKFRLNDLHEIMKKSDIDDSDYPVGTHKFIVDLMRKFELCYKLPRHDVYENNPTYLVPGLLDRRQPPLPEHNGPVLHFYFKYEDILPKSIVPRFIVRMHDDIENDLQWRTGLVMVIKKFHSKAIVVADIKSQKINISISGTDRKAHFGIIRKTFHDLHKPFENLNVTEWIPLPDEPEYAIEYEDLKGYEESGKGDYFFGKLKKSYRVKDLLNGIEQESSRKNEYKWDVFLCHSSLDKYMVRNIAQDLKLNGITYWIDEERIKNGDSIITAISDGLENTKAIIACISKIQIESGWARDEYEIILSKMYYSSSEQKVYILILDDIAHKDIPIFLSHKLYCRYENKNDYNKLMKELKDFFVEKNK